MNAPTQDDLFLDAVDAMVRDGLAKIGDDPRARLGFFKRLLAVTHEVAGGSARHSYITSGDVTVRAMAPGKQLNSGSKLLTSAASVRMEAGSVLFNPLNCVYPLHDSGLHFFCLCQSQRRVLRNYQGLLTHQISHHRR